MFMNAAIEPLLHCYFSVYAIKCWDCRSDADPKCSDPFDNTTFAITDCKQLPELDYLPNARATMCRKIRQKGNCHFDIYF